MLAPVRWSAVLALFFCLLTACGGGGANGGDDHAGSGSTPSGADVETVQLLTSLSTTYYDVQGTTTEEIFRYIEQRGPTDSDGKRGSGITSVVWAYNWTGDRARNGSCAIDGMTIRADITIMLPRHADPSSLTPALLENWKTYEDGVAKHEQRHVDIYLSGAEDIKEDMAAIGLREDCEELEQEVETVWQEQQARINAQQEAFHREEDMRLAERRRPLEAQIEANRGKINTLQRDIGALDRQISGLRSEIAGIDGQIDSVEAQIQQITEQFPGVLPPTVKERLEGLVIQRNELLGTYNTRVDAHNKALSQRSALVSELEPLLAATNELVDQFNWSR